MKEILVTYWASILVVILFVFILLALWQRGKKRQVKAAIYWFVAEAEKKLGDKAGVYKYGHVINKFYERLPFILTLFFTKKEIDEWIEYGVQELKEYLSNGNDLNGNIDLIDYE